MASPASPCGSSPVAAHEDYGREWQAHGCGRDGVHSARTDRTPPSTQIMAAHTSGSTGQRSAAGLAPDCPARGHCINGSHSGPSSAI
jgi:hypothetical protein